MADKGSNYTKGFVAGALIGGAVGAITALLLAPKSGKELRQDIANKSTEVYGKAGEYWNVVEDKVGTTVSHTINEGKIKAQNIINTAKRQAEDLMNKAENVLADAKEKAYTAKDTVVNKYETVKDAAKAGAEAFRNELREQNDKA